MRAKFSTFLIYSFLIAITFVFNACDNSTKKGIKVAYVGRYVGVNESADVSERSREFSLLHEEVLKRYIQKFNRNSNTPIELVTFNNYKNPDSTIAVYKRIALDESIVGVIDNSWSVEITAAKNVIKQSGLPVIIINAAINKEDFGEQTLFMTNYSQSIEDIVSMSTVGLGKDTVDFISRTDGWPHQEYLNELTKNGITVRNTFFYDGNSSMNFNKDDLEDIGESPNPIIQNTFGPTSGILLDTLLLNFSNKIIVGHAEISPQYDKLKMQDGNQVLLLAESESAVNLELYEDVNFLKSNYPVLEKFNLAFFSKRCQDAWYIMEGVINDLPGLVDNQSFKNGIIEVRENGIVTPHEWMQFDAYGTLIKEQNFIHIAENTIDNFDLQINEEKEIIPNLNIGVEIIDVQNIDLNRDQFHADFFYWVTYDTTFSNLEDKITFININELENTTKLIKEKTIGNKTYKLYKVSANFIQKFDKRNFPFDSHELIIQIQLLDPNEKLRVSFDKDNFQQQFGDLITSGWKSSRFYVTVDNTVTQHLKGDYPDNQLQYHKFKNIFFRLQISRIGNMGLLRVVLPLFFIGLLVIMLLYIEDAEFTIIGGILAAVFLTIITFSISLSRVIPLSNILTKASLLYIITFITVVICFLIGLYYHIQKTSRPSIKIVRNSLMVLYIITFLTTTLMRL